MKMGNRLLITLVCALMLLFPSCSSATPVDPKRLDTAKESFLQGMSVFQVDTIEDSVAAGAVAEYRVVICQSKSWGDDLYLLRVLKDGSGMFIIKQFKESPNGGGELISDLSYDLKKPEVNTLLQSIGRNNFWTLQDDNVVGFDGTTYYMEGYANSKTRFIMVWEPEKGNGIYQISLDFVKFAETVEREG